MGTYAADITYKPVATIDLSSGRLHIRVREYGADGSLRRTLVDERCQTDQSGQYDTASDLEVALRESADSCKFCVKP